MNLYFFRNMITGKVIVSKQFQLESCLLNQIGEHRPSLKIRQDHWVPFTVLTGLPKNGHLATHLLNTLTTIRHIGPLPKYRLPLPPSPPPALKARIEENYRPRLSKGQFGHAPLDRAETWVGWRVPDMVREKSLAICRVLNSDVVLKGLKEEVVDGNPMRLLTLWWEREEYRFLVDAERRRLAEEGREVGKLEWPEYVSHRKLALVRNRYPLVPGMPKSERFVR
ncbi:hypothetical protein HDU67_000333 [Dinochytrium kinnereticum]|nr:hypothetical protein HDU67_000333 [Dinochytrium kinnereticum]